MKNIKTLIEKRDFIINYLQPLVVELDRGIDRLEIIEKNDDVSVVRIVYAKNWARLVLVECDSKLSIARDVLRAID